MGQDQKTMGKKLGSGIVGGKPHSTAAQIDAAVAFTEAAGTGNGAGLLDPNAITVVPELNERQILQTQLAKWKAALIKVMNKTGDAKILMLGDSTTSGEQSGAATIVDGSSSPRLTTLLNSIVPAAQGMGIYPVTGADLRWTLGTGWGRNSFAGMSGSSVKGTNPTSGNLVYAPSDGAVYDSFDVYYIGGAGHDIGTITVTATGGTPIVADGSSGTTGIRKVTCTTATPSTALTLTVSQTINNVWFIGAEPFLSTQKRVRVANCGVGSSTTSTWLLDYSLGSGLDCAKAYHPDLTIINLGINDGLGNVAVNTVSANLQTLITGCKISGDVIIVAFLPTSLSHSGGVGNQADQLAMIRALAVANSIPLFDFAGFYGGVNPGTLLSPDGIHPSALGYYDMANGLFPLMVN